MTMRYDFTVTGPTVNGRGNPELRGAQWPRRVLSRPSCVHRFRAQGKYPDFGGFAHPMAAPGGASFGWAGFSYPVFHLRSCAAALICIESAALAAGGAA
ncbi:hypothetical protein [Achromobacter sp. 2789STDY5608628]|uniref:hypothetical protein n=1 Tax=Achromobacter sp. 2789STDY5608628 TaxID=1806493 RepID=UPI0012E175A5|nr:hypothetical protein [Achromobacter sp. 2789STDY5608628]